MILKNEVYELLKNKNSDCEIYEHEAVFTMSELSSAKLKHPECEAKNLFVRDDKRKNYYLITVKGDKRVDLKEFRRTFGLKPLTFAHDDELFSILGVHAGSVSPFGLLNDENKSVIFYIDEAFFDKPKKIGVHPNDNTATVMLNADDLIAIIKEHGNEINVVKFC